MPVFKRQEPGWLPRCFLPAWSRHFSCLGVGVLLKQVQRFRGYWLGAFEGEAFQPPPPPPFMRKKAWVGLKKLKLLVIYSRVVFRYLPAWPDFFWAPRGDGGPHSYGSFAIFRNHLEPRTFSKNFRICPPTVILFSFHSPSNPLENQSWDARISQVFKTFNTGSMANKALPVPFLCISSYIILQYYY